MRSAIFYCGTIVAVGGLVTIYWRRLCAQSRQVDQAWSNIEVLLRQRLEELSKVTLICLGVPGFNRKVVDALLHARSHWTSARLNSEKIEAAGEISAALAQFLAEADNCPELRHSSEYLTLRKRLAMVEMAIVSRRDFFNDHLMNFNKRIEKGIGRLVATFAGISMRPPYTENLSPSIVVNPRESTSYSERDEVERRPHRHAA